MKIDYARGFLVRNETIRPLDFRPRGNSAAGGAHMRFYLRPLLIFFSCLISPIQATAAEGIAAFRSQREAYVDHLRKTGDRPSGPARALESQLRAALSATPPGNRSELLYELATIQRIQGQFKDAAKTYQLAINDAFGRSDVLFDAWIGMARTYSYGTSDLGAAERAFQRAVEVAGANPTRKRRFEMADYASQLQERRGELEAALVSALEANRLAGNDEERFSAQFDTGGVLMQFANSCDYRRLVDAKSVSDLSDDGWGACRRTVAAASSYYARARDTAERLGWDYFQQMSEEFITGNLRARLSLIESKASIDKAMHPDVFNAEQVVVNEAFEVGMPPISELTAILERAANVGTEDARTNFLRGLQAEAGADGDSALPYFERAVQLLEDERASLFDMRQRGTVVEGGPEFARALALKLLARGSFEKAFATFEANRARGLGDLAVAYEAQKLSETERMWVADYVNLELMESENLTRVVEATIAGEENQDTDGNLDRLVVMRSQNSKR